MTLFLKQVQLRWSDLDPNFHLRHSVYYDWGAMGRMEYLTQLGLTAALMQHHHFGPIIFREECVFRKEIRYGDEVTMNLRLVKGRRDYSRWTLQHEFFKQGEVLCAVLTIDGAWMNTQERKLFIPPAEVATVFDQMPRPDDFQWSE